MSKDLFEPVELFEGRHIDGLDSVRFVDIDLRASTDLELIWEALHEVPDRLAGARTVVFRWPTAVTPDDAGQLTDFARSAVRRADAVGRARIEVFGAVVGGPPVHVAAVGEPSVSLQALRELEFASMLDNRAAFIAGTDHHFVLPSTSHSDVFVRVANTLRTPRDVWVVASWLAEFVTSGCGLVYDTASLTPIAVQLASFATGAGLQLGDVGSLDSYPSTDQPIRRAVTSASTSGRCLAMLSVDSTGSTIDAFVRELRARNPGQWQLHTLVSCNPVRHDASEVETWCRTTEGVPMSADQCTTCAEPTRAFLVAIDPVTYFPKPNMNPEKFVPSTAEGDNAAFWELADKQGAVLLESLPSQQAYERRSERTALGVRIDFEALTSDSESLLIAIERRLKKLRESTLAGSYLRRSRSHVLAVLKDAKDADVLLVDQQDASSPSLRSALSALGLNVDKLRIVHDEKELRAGAQPNDRVLCFSWGSLTGSGLKRMRVEVTDAYGETPHSINGLCLHARPPTNAEWGAAMRSFGPGRLGALWLTYLPWASPLRKERELLAQLSEPSTISEARVDALSDADPASNRQRQPVLWGVAPPYKGQSRVRDTSIYGRQISTNTVFAALGAAMQLSRVEKQHSVRRAVVNLGAVVNLAGIGGPYFDANLIACMLRWTEPAEAWWGLTSDEQRTTLDLLWDAGGQTLDELAVLIPELFLAAALGKMTQVVVVRLVERYEEFLEGGGWTNSADESTVQPREALANEARRIAMEALRRQ